MSSSIYQATVKALNKASNPEKAAFSHRFFKTGTGQYGEGDVFIGLTAPQLRTIAKAYYLNSTLKDIRKLLQSPIHEFRLAAIFILVMKFQKTRDEKIKKEIADFYLENTLYVNNWDLVDSSAEKILGAFLFDKDKSLLYHLAESENLWEQRIAIIATFYFIKKNHLEYTFAIAKKLLDHKHDLIHKATGWMLREAGKRDFNKEYDFLIKHYKSMPRTMLRYSIEKFDIELRKKFLKGLL
jgi:3-methyladenine DNA glycosylase AlkD